MLRAALIPVLAFTVLCGLAYPLAVTGAAQVLFPVAAGGSLVEHDGRVVGSRLIGQDFSGRPDLFQSRPSATGYSASATFFNNLGPNQADLADQQRTAARDFARREGIAIADVPADAATTSASGVDPHVSVENARLQAQRVARATGIPPERVQALVGEHTDGRGLGVLGEPGVNVLTLNLAIEQEAR
jgi:potassium-transporting ATPase KdpC subunit